MWFIPLNENPPGQGSLSQPDDLSSGGRHGYDAEPMRLPERYQRYLPYFPAAIAGFLVIPVLGFTYIWDDYGFLTNAIFYQLHDWLPDPADPFYRPLSRGVYFTLLGLA